MKNQYHISEAEREVMEMIWKQGEPVKQSSLLLLLEESGKEWKRQTLNTFLSRLEEKGFVKRESRIVRAVHTEEEFNQLQMQESVDQLYHGRLSELVLAFAKQDALSKEEAEEIMELMRRRVEGN